MDPVALTNGYGRFSLRSHTGANGPTLLHRTLVRHIAPVVIEQLGFERSRSCASSVVSP